MRSVFVCGTDTGVGKTLVTGLLADYFAGQGLNVITQKWVQTGSSDMDDINEHLRIQGKTSKHIQKHKHLVCPYLLKFPASPHLAAKQENRSINKTKIISSYKRLLSSFDMTIVEGVGGALVPIDGKTLVVDIVKFLKIPVIIVSGNKLGAINHTLLTVEALKSRKIPILGIVFNDMYPDQDETILRDNAKISAALSGQKVLGRLPICLDLATAKKLSSTIFGSIMR